MEEFTQQLAATAEHNPELATSPFLLSLMIEVFKEHGAVPSQRVELYAKQVEGIVWRCMQAKLDRRDACEALRMEDDAGKSATWALACEYLEALSYVCQMQLETRDFTLAACSQDMRSLWQHDTGLLADVGGLLLSEPS